MYFYEDDMAVPHSQAKEMIHKDAADDLVNAVIKHDHDEISDGDDKAGAFLQRTAVKVHSIPFSKAAAKIVIF